MPILALSVGLLLIVKEAVQIYDRVESSNHARYQKPGDKDANRGFCDDKELVVPQAGHDKIGFNINDAEGNDPTDNSHNPPISPEWVFKSDKPP